MKAGKDCVVLVKAGKDCIVLVKAGKDCVVLVKARQRLGCLCEGTAKTVLSL